MTADHLLTPSLLRQLKPVTFFLLDFEGVLMDEGTAPTPRHPAQRTVHPQDSAAISAAQKAGIRFAIMSGRPFEDIEEHARELHIDDIMAHAYDKAEAYREFRRRHGLWDEEIAYMGNGVLDLPVLRQAGFAAAPRNCHPSVKVAVHYVTHQPGGHGAVHEAIELLLAAKKTAAT